MFPTLLASTGCFQQSLSCESASICTFILRRDVANDVDPQLWAAPDNFTVEHLGQMATILINSDEQMGPLI
jgi:hypothetical protein